MSEFAVNNSEKTFWLYQFQEAKKNISVVRFGRIVEQLFLNFTFLLYLLCSATKHRCPNGALSVFTTFKFKRSVADFN